MKRLLSLILIFTLLITAILPTFIDARSSTMWGEDNRRTRNTGVSLSKNYSLIPTGPVKYSANGKTYLTESHASPTLIETVDGRTIMYVKDSENQRISAIDLANPTSQLWNQPIANTKFQPSTPMYYGKTKENPDHKGYNNHDVVFVATGDYMYALDAWTGVPVSFRDISKPGRLNQIGSHPLVVETETERYLYIGSNNGYFYGFDLNNNMARKIDKFIGGWVSAAPTQVGDKIVVGTDDAKGKVYVMDYKGNTIHTYTTNAGVTSAAIALSSTEFLLIDKKANIYKGDINGNFTAINTSLGTGRNKTLHPMALGNDGYAYFTLDYDSNNRGQVYSVNLSTGELKHLYEATGNIVSAPTVTNEAIFFAEAKGDIIAIEKKTGKPYIWYENTKYKAESSGTQLFSSVTIAGGKHNYITIATNDGINVYAPLEPNLTITNIAPSNANYKTGETKNYNITIKNDGYNDASNFVLKLYKNSIHESNGIGETIITSLKKGETKTITIPVTFGDPGTYKIIAFVDAYNTVSETSEEDNTIETKAYVERYVTPGQVFADFNINPNPVGQNQTFDYEDLAKAINDTIIKREWTLTTTQTYNWETNAYNEVTTGTRPTKIADKGIYTVTYKVTTQNGKIATATKDLEVVKEPPDVYGKPPVVDFDLATPIWQGDTIQYSNKSYDPDGTVIQSTWSYKKKGTGTWYNGLPLTTSIGVYYIKLTVMDNDYNFAEKTKELTILERITTTDLIPGNEYAYPTLNKTPFPYEVDISDMDFKDWSYKLPKDFPIWEYEVRTNEDRIILFKKDDYHIYEVVDGQVIDVTPTEFYTERSKKFVIKDLQFVGNSIMVSGYYLFWGHYSEQNFVFDSWRYSQGQISYGVYDLEKYTDISYTKPNLIFDEISYNIIPVTYTTSKLRINASIRNYSNVRATGELDLSIAVKSGWYTVYNNMNSTKIDLLPMGTSETYSFEFPIEEGKMYNINLLIDSNDRTIRTGRISEFVKAIDELTETDNTIESHPAAFSKLSWSMYENMPIRFYEDYTIYNTDAERPYIPTNDYDIKPYDITVPVTETSKNMLFELDNNLNITNQITLEDTYQTNDMQIRKVDDQKALIAYDYKHPFNTIINGYTSESNLVVGLYNVTTNVYSKLYQVEREGVLGYETSGGSSATGVVWDYYYKEDFRWGTYYHFFKILKGPGYAYEGKLLDFEFDGESGWILGDISQEFYSTTGLVLRIVSYNEEKVNSGYYYTDRTTSQIAIKVEYDQTTGEFSFDQFKQAGSESKEHPYPYQYWQEIKPDPNYKTTWKVNNIIPSSSGFLAYNGSYLFDSKESVNEGLYDAHYNLSYLIADTLQVSPSEIGNIEVFSGIDTQNYSLLYVKRLTTNTYHLLAYDGISIKEYTLPGFPDGTIISNFNKVTLYGKEYILITGNNNGQPVLYYFDPPRNLFNVPLYFSIKTDYDIPIGTHIFNNKFANQTDIVNKLNNNYNIKIWQKLPNGTTNLYNSFSLDSTQAKEISTSSRGATYLSFYKPFYSDVEAEYTVELNVNPNRSIIEQNYLKQPLYANNINYSRFITIDDRKPLASMNNKRLLINRDGRNWSWVYYTIYQSTSMDKYVVYAKNVDTGQIYTIQTGTNPTDNKIYYSASGTPEGKYEMNVAVYTKYNQILLSDPVPFEVTRTSPPTITLTNPSSNDINNPTILTTKRPTYTWTYSDIDGDPQERTRLYIRKQTATGWSTINSLYTYNSSVRELTSTVDLEENVLYMIEANVSDGYQTGYDEPRYFRIVNNRPPVANFTYRPSVVYEGDTITFTDISTDPDNNITSHLWTIIRPNGTQYIISTRNMTITNAMKGTYQVKKRVNDSYGSFSETAFRNIVVSDLTITGDVRHTDLWNEHRIDFNLAKTGTIDSPRTYNTFWTGEKFVLYAETTQTDPVSSDRALSVNVSILNEGYSTILNVNPDGYTWQGELWDESMMNKWGRNSVEPLTFRFIVTYSNGIVKINDVVIYMDTREEYWQFHKIK